MRKERVNNLKRLEAENITGHIPMDLQKFASEKTGVYPCYDNQFQINTAASGATAVMSDIADCVSFEVSFDNGVEEWTPYSTQGWLRRMMTAKAVTISVSAKRSIGDAGSDLVAGLAWKNAQEVEKDFQWTFPDGTVVKFTNAIINVTNAGSGESTSVAPLEFEVMSNGKPVITPAI